MQKMMFNKTYGLESEVLERLKEMTRRVVPEKLLLDAMEYGGGDIGKRNRYLIEHAPFKVGEVVAVAQSYKEIDERSIVGYKDASDIQPGMVSPIFATESPGWNNKMFVRADLMPNQIRITDIKVEQLQDITDEDCGKEGIVPFTWRQWLKQEFGDFGPQKYKDWNVWTLPKFTEGLSDPWGDSDPNEFMADSPRAAFAVLIDRVSGKGTWESNPLVYAYTFELLETNKQ